MCFCESETLPKSACLMVRNLDLQWIGLGVEHLTVDLLAIFMAVADHQSRMPPDLTIMTNRPMYASRHEMRFLTNLFISLNVVYKN